MILSVRTGEMLTTPVKPAGSPANFYVNENSREFFESKVVWPIGYMHSAVATAPVRIQETVSRWVGPTTSIVAFELNINTNTCHIA